MCGRYTIFSDIQKLIEQFGLSNTIELLASFNAAPSQKLPVIIQDRIGLLRWGYIPKWARGREEEIKPQINARSETAFEKPFFRDSFASRRCLIPANGFYEWQKVKGGKKPWYFTKNNELIAFAGIFNKEGFCILTKESIAPVSDIHGRMPVILPKSTHHDWIHGTAETARQIIAETPPPKLLTHVVSDRLNSPANDDETLIEKAQLL